MHYGVDAPEVSWRLEFECPPDGDRVGDLWIKVTTYCIISFVMVWGTEDIGRMN